MNAWRMSRDGVSAVLGASALVAASGLLVPVRVLNAQDGAAGSAGASTVSTVTNRPVSGPGVEPATGAAEPAVEAQAVVPAPGASAPAAAAPAIAAPTGNGAAAPGEGAQGVRVSDYMTVDIFVQDEELATVLNMLSLQSRRNIVASKEVSATVSANLYGVSFKEALDSILEVNGFGYIEKGNFIYVYPIEKVIAITEAERKPVSKVLRLNYLNAVDAAEFVKGQLSEVGQIQTNGDVGDFSIPDDAPTGGEDFALSATMVVTDYPENIEEIEKLIAQLDSRPSQVLVEATILQTSLTEDNAFGVDFSVLGDVDFHDFIGLGSPLDTTNLINDGDVLPNDDTAFSGTSTAGNSQGPSTVKVGILTDSISVFVRALDEVSDVTILSNPKLLVLNRQPARVLVGRKIGYLNTTSTETSTTQTVEFLDTGTQLNVKPFISNDGMIRLELKPRVSEGVIRTATDVEGSAVTIPDEITQELTTNIIVPDGSTVVLGGLFKETTSLTRRQIPILGDIPIVGLPFRGHEDSTDRAEIIFMIRTSIVNESVLQDQGARALSYSEDVRAGARSGLLPFSRDKMSAQMNVEAERLAAEGNNEKAAWMARRSLELNPAQPDAVRLLRRVGDEDRRVPASSILDRIISGEVDQVLPSRSSASTRITVPAQQTANVNQPNQAGASVGAVDADGTATMTQSPAVFAESGEAQPAQTTASFDETQEIDPTTFGGLENFENYDTGSHSLDAAPTSDVSTMEDLDPTAGGELESQPLFDDTGMNEAEPYSGDESFEQVEPLGTDMNGSMFESGAPDEVEIEPDSGEGFELNGSEPIEFENSDDMLPDADEGGSPERASTWVIPMSRWNFVWMPSPQFVLSTLHAQARAKPAPIMETRVSMGLEALSSPASLAPRPVRFAPSGTRRPDVPLRDRNSAGVLMARMQTSGGIDVLAYAAPEEPALTQSTLVGRADAWSVDLAAVFEASPSAALAQRERDELHRTWEPQLTGPTIIAMVER